MAPTPTTPALAGSALAPRKFAISVSYRGWDQQPIPLSTLEKSALQIRVPNCQLAQTGGSCVLGADHYEVVSPFVGGNLYVIAWLPPDFFPPVAPGTKGLLDLEVTLDGLTSTANGALSYRDGFQMDGVVLAIDKSASMGFPSAKLRAARTVAKALIRSFVPPAGFPTTTAGIVSFNEEADTDLPYSGLLAVDKSSVADFDKAIDAIQAGGQTSLGDALLESQSVLRNLDESAALFDRTEIILLTDGKSTVPATPWDYYANHNPPPNDGRGSPWVYPYNYHQRWKVDAPIPVISSIAIGPDADVSELMRLARLTDGSVVFIDDFFPSVFELVVELAKGGFGAWANAAGYEQVSAERLAAGTELTIPVEPGAQELRVNVLSAEPRAARALLRSPTGVDVPPTATDPDDTSSSFRVFEPASGTWTMISHPFDGLEVPPIFVEATLKSPVQMFTRFDAPDVRPLSADAPAESDDLRAFVGAGLDLTAMVVADGVLEQCSATASVVLPDGSRARLELQDDGRHGDGAAGDGLFGAHFRRTGQPGLYTARIKTSCELETADMVITRERTLGVALDALPDADGNGLPDVWEASFGLPEPGSEDADDDGLNDLAEFHAGTNPRASDSDGGGESDGSEIAMGRDPNDPEDDLIATPDLLATPGNTMVYLAAGTSQEGVRVVASRAASASGPFDVIPAETPVGQFYVVDADRPNDVRACYRIRAERAGLRSGWSEVACTTPRRDPVAPVVRVVSSPNSTHTRDVTLSISAIDPLLASDAALLPVDLGVFASGVDAIRVWFGAGPADGAAWQEPVDELLLRLPDQNVSTISLQARDRAGNVGAPVLVIVRRPLRTAVDRAIAKEEAAADAIETGDDAAARARIGASLGDIDESFKKAVERVSQKKGKPEEAVHVLTTVVKIRGLKTKALALLKANKPPEALESLRQALESEIGLAVWADGRGIEL